jgi:hypothetical protein
MHNLNGSQNAGRAAKPLNLRLRRVRCVDSPMVLLDYFIWKLDLLSFDVRRVPGIRRMKPGRIKAAFVRGYGFRYPVGGDGFIEEAARHSPGTV